MTPFNFKIPLELTKSYVEDGKMFVIGEATGPELDLDEERMRPKAIKGMQEQITKAFSDGVAIPLRDAHLRDGVLMELGTVIDASVTDGFHLITKSELDQDNPAAVKLFKDLQKGKKYGLSVRGDAMAEKAYNEEAGKVITEYDEVTLKEISVTVKPAWTHSFLTSLSKSYQKAMKEEVQKDTVVETPVEETIETKPEEVNSEPEVEVEEVTPEVTEPETETVEETTEVAETVNLEEGKSAKEVKKSAIDYEIYNQIAKACELLQNILKMQDADINIDEAEEASDAQEEIMDAMYEGKSAKEINGLYEIEKSKAESLEKSLLEISAKVEHLMKQPQPRKGVVVEVNKSAETETEIDARKATILELSNKNEHFNKIVEAAGGDYQLINDTLKNKK